MNRFALVILAIVTLAIPLHADTSMDGRLEFDKVKPVLLGAGPSAQADVVQLKWIVFHKVKADKHVLDIQRPGQEIIEARLRVVMLSWPKGKWRATVSILDSKGSSLQSTQAVFENLGVIISRPMISEGDLRFTLGVRPDAALFRVEIAPAKDEPVSEELVMPGTDFRAATNYHDEKADRTLDVSVLGGGTKLPVVDLQFWCRAEKDYQQQPLSALSDVPLVWKSEGVTWRPCLSFAGQGTIGHLYPDIFRVSFTTRGADPTPARVIGTFDLRAKKTDTAISVPRVGFPLTVRIVDEKTGKPMPREPLLLFAPDGLPIADGSSGFHTQADDAGMMRYSSLEPGIYRLEVGPRGWWYAIHPESVKVMPVEVKVGQENSITVRYTEPIPVRDP